MFSVLSGSIMNICFQFYCKYQQSMIGVLNVVVCDALYTNGTIRVCAKAKSQNLKDQITDVYNYLHL